MRAFWREKGGVYKEKARRRRHSKADGMTFVQKVEIYFLLDKNTLGCYNISVPLWVNYAHLGLKH